MDAGRAYLGLVGALLVLGGVGGFFFDGSFGTAARSGGDEILGIFLVNGWTNVLHLSLGLAALTAAPAAPRWGALALGAILLMAGLWGLGSAEQGAGSPLGLFSVDTQTSTLQLLAGLAGPLAILVPTRMGPPRPRASRASR